MGRIAEALKRADEQRRLAMESPLGGTAVLPEPLRTPVIPFPSTDPIPPPASSNERPPLVGGLSESLLPFLEPASLVTEQYRSLRTRLLSQNPHNEHRIMAITSAVPKEGKSVTTLNLGAVVAEIQHLRVLVVDGDFRRSSLATMLNQPAGPGLADVLAGEAAYEEVIQDTPIANLKFIPAGSTKRRSAAELLANARARPTFKRMQSDFHYVIVDTPPATTVTDVGIIGQMCSSVIVIVRLHRTQEAAAKRAVRLLQVNNIPILGCLIVGRDSAVDRYGYGYAYRSSYYRYYSYLKQTDGEEPL